MTSKMLDSFKIFLSIKTNDYRKFLNWRDHYINMNTEANNGNVVLPLDDYYFIHHLNTIVLEDQIKNKTWNHTIDRFNTLITHYEERLNEKES